MNGFKPELTEPDVDPRAAPNESRRNISNWTSGKGRDVVEYCVVLSVNQVTDRRKIRYQVSQKKSSHALAGENQ
ncbi:hypothetical protein R1X32_02800 (plasmid) [Rhodococcus opacus]|uniref:hypothetical protein n=1 Tax=Rhodococcus opacus TaxID=37919 RepID=UPI00146DC4F5|nr:hypothetical protein HJ581_0046435 [Rhodococcus opacus]